MVIAGQSSFLHLTEDHKPKYTLAIESTNKIFYPIDTTDTQNPLPYIFDSAEELQKYLELARKETFETLLHKVEEVYKKYVNAEEYYILILAADTIYSYFQDKFGTTHYNIFVGDNGSGKNSALLVYRYLGYRVFYVFGNGMLVGLSHPWIAPHPVISITGINTTMAATSPNATAETNEHDFKYGFGWGVGDYHQSSTDDGLDLSTK